MTRELVAEARRLAVPEIRAAFGPVAGGLRILVHELADALEDALDKERRPIQGRSDNPVESPAAASLDSQESPK